MERNDLITYMQSLRNLEVLKYHNATQLSACQEKHAALKKESTPAIVCFSLESAAIVGLIVLLVMLALAIASALYANVYEKGSYVQFFLFAWRYMIPILCAVVGIAVAAGCGTFSEIRDEIDYCFWARRKNKELSRKKAQYQQQISACESEISQLHAELNTVNTLLEEAYSFNIIPSQYRSLAYILYIYDYLSTSSQSLESALLHSHIEDGVQRISKQLNTVISQNLQAIQLLKQNLQQNQELFNQLHQLSHDVRLNNYYTKVNGYYLQSHI